MSYTALAALGVVAAIVLDRWVARTRITSTSDWWSAYAIIVFFQLLTNGWLTGRGIVRYDPDTILGSEDVVLVGDGRILFAPVEDLAFGFALVLTSCVAWTWLGRHRAADSTVDSAVDRATS
ncbi:lycopene cyclase domain-containing protein [Nocardioides renjunii]|uniref:lycopene cyclase domain-containing protein n=1 Tax=Nocardioides renjunii TaxID=3095075 RepID=UPI002AFE5412|nr:lycopene cyclase domain-containing protein [Nocardioides sp. S-34]WQQ20776.1 lycopene cyclase domain-containing protein [Nocardioides sp. S-34]